MQNGNTVLGARGTDLSSEGLFADLDEVKTGIAIYTRDFQLIFANRAVREYLPKLYETLDAGGSLLDGILAQVRAISPNVKDIECQSRAKHIHALIEKAGTMELDTPTGIRLKSTYSKTSTGNYILTTADVTDHIRYEERLSETTYEAEQANQAKSEFLANMSHEIRTPMSGVFMAAQLLQQQLKTLNLPELSDLADILVGSTSHLSGVINQVLDMSKIEAGQVDIVQQDGSLSDMLRVLVKSQSLVAEERGIYLKLAVDPRLPKRMSYDPLRVRQCVMNLVNNALKFTAIGGVTIGVLYNPETSMVTIHVADTGPGIAAEDRMRVFGQFGQVKDSKHQPFAGTGLGLSISRNLAQLMGGDIKLTSELGRGAVFSLAFISEPSAAIFPSRKLVAL